MGADLAMEWMERRRSIKDDEMVVKIPKPGQSLAEWLRALPERPDYFFTEHDRAPLREWLANLPKLQEGV